MFTGIVTATGSIESISKKDGQARFRVGTHQLDLADVKPGDSIAVNGACLTAVELHADGFSADLSRETLEFTTFDRAAEGDTVNLETALALGDSLGGHLVTGHVDGVGKVLSVTPDAGSLQLSIEAPELLAPYIAKKGSICVDGASLTVNGIDGIDGPVSIDGAVFEVTGTVFEVTIVPHTRTNTIIAGYEPGTFVNIEIDMIARYLDRLLVQYTES